MTTNNCANGPKLVLKVFCAKRPVTVSLFIGVQREGSGSGGLGKSKDSSKHFALITKFVSYFDSQLLII